MGTEEKVAAAFTTPAPHLPILDRSPNGVIYLYNFLYVHAKGGKGDC